jgi:hypothetical protein
MTKPLLPLLACALAGLAAPALANAPAPDGGEAVTVLDLATLTFHEALCLLGHRERYAVVPDSVAETVGGFVAFDCVAPQGRAAPSTCCRARSPLSG